MHNYSKNRRTWKGEICAIHNPPKTQTENPCHHRGQVTGVAKKDPFSKTEVKVTLKLDHDVVLCSGWKHLPLDTSLPAWYAALYECSCPCWNRYPDLTVFSTSISNPFSARRFMMNKQYLVRSYCFNQVLVILATWFVSPLEAQISKKGWWSTTVSRKPLYKGKDIKDLSDNKNHGLIKGKQKTVKGKVGDGM